VRFASMSGTLSPGVVSWRLERRPSGDLAPHIGVPRTTPSVPAALVIGTSIAFPRQRVKGWSM
jgi:hypothetical protein